MSKKEYGRMLAWRRFCGLPTWTLTLKYHTQDLVKLVRGDRPTPAAKLALMRALRSGQFAHRN